MTVLREVLARFGIEADTSALGNLSGGIDGVVGKLQGLGTALAAGLAINSLRNFVTEMANIGDELDETSNRLGISSDELQTWRHAAQMSGVEAGELDAGFTALFRNLQGAMSGGTQGQLFRRLGVDIRDAQGEVRSLDQLLPEIADGFTQIPNRAEQAGLAMQLFGRSGSRLVPLLAQGSAGVEELRREFQRLGGGVSADVVQQSAQFNDEMDRLDLALLSLKSRVVTVFLPAITRTLEKVTEISSAFIALADNSHLVEAALIVLGAIALAFGVKFVIGFAGPLLIAGAVAIAIAFIIFLVDDLITLFSGGKSVIGGFIDEMFGAGTAAQLVLDLKTAWEGVTLAIRRASFAVRDFFGMTDPGETAPTASGVSDVSDAFETQAREAAREGRIVGRPGENRDAVMERFNRNRRNLINSGEIQATQEDVADGLAPRVGFTGGRGREGQTGARQARLPRRGGAQGGNRTQVDARTNAQINVPPGTDRAQLDAMRRVVGEVMDQRNREVAAAMAEETVAGEESEDTEE